MSEILSLKHFLTPETKEPKQQKEQREELVEQLRSGIEVAVGEQTITFQLIEFENEVYVQARLGNQPIASSHASIHPETGIADEMGKRYEDEISDDLKGKGLITAVSALLFQYLIAEGYKKVSCRIGRNNQRSLYTQLIVPDLIRGGFFNHAFQDTGQLANYLVVTDLSTDKPILERPLNQNKLVEDFKRKNQNG